MRQAIVTFFDANETWLAGVLAQGRADGTLAIAGDPREQAQSVLAALEGAMLVALHHGDPQRFDAAAARLLATLAG
jgi:TetR/AcrR family transcriptional repressor of nem operon